jgi:hypothetical protein
MGTLISLFPSSSDVLAQAFPINVMFSFPFVSQRLFQHFGA